MFKKIVWATDGSDSADLALPYVKSLAAQDGAEVLVVHSEEVFVGRAAGYPVRADEADVVAKIEKQVEDLRSAGTNARLEVASGHTSGAAHAVADAAAAAHADLIVVGTRGHTPIGGLLLGSVTQRLLHISPCPVLSIPALGKVAEGQTTDTAQATA